jgi:hypothetical protein
MLSVMTRYETSNSELMLAAGDPLGVNADAVLCYSSSSLTMQSHLATRLVLDVGPALRLEASKHAPARIGDALVLPAGRLSYRYVLVAIINALRTTPTLESVRASLQTALRRAASLDLGTLVVPLLRVRRKLNDDDLLLTTLTALLEPLSAPTSLRQVTLVIDDEALAFSLSQRVADLLPDLAKLAKLRICATNLLSLDMLIELPDPALTTNLSQALLQQRRTYLQQALQLCERIAGRTEWARSLGLAAELRRCRADLTYADDLLTTALGGRERAVGVDDAMI